MSDHTNDIAVVGMAGRFPGARDLMQFWENLRNGVESVRFLSREELLAGGEQEHLLQHPHYVNACPVLEGVDLFDAGFFGLSPRDAAIMDPQHRLFLETAWEAMENAGYNPENPKDSVAVYASSGMNLYMMQNLITNPELMDSLGDFLVRHAGNDKDFLATRVSYELNLKGPSINVQTACSSSLVAVHLAIQSLLGGECDMAMAGGVTILFPQARGYVFKEGEILSPDGHCRAFDAASKGTIFGSGVGIVVLKRLENARADGDNILAVIKSSAINNDGAMKVGYLAPSVEGQAKAIAEALTLSGVDPETISYVEAHGTGTLVGDPIEVTALAQAFASFTARKGFCAIGSLKSNIGHLGETAGVAGFIKTVLSLQNGLIPPSLNYSKPNPQIDFPSTPFFVNTKLTEWKSEGHPRRAGVTALGAGGTNAHVVVEEAPPRVAAGASRSSQVLLLSARTSKGLDIATDNLADHLKKFGSETLADVAYTLAVGRKGFEHRRLVVCSSHQEAIERLNEREDKGLESRLQKTAASVVFMFPGGGAQYATMGSELYANEPVYRAAIDECIDYVNLQFGFDLRTLMFPKPVDAAAATQRLERPSLALPTLFATEYALSKLLISWGVEPAAMIGHSMGEYVAACVAGVFSFKEGMDLVTLRGKLFETLPDGAMLSVALPEREARELMSPELSIAAVNGPSLVVVSGPKASVAEMEAALTKREIECTRLHIDVAAHSAMLEPILREFERVCRSVRFSPPQRPYISNLSGTWITPQEATDPLYWVRHLRNTVRFAQGISELVKEAGRIFLEVGPGRTLSSLVKQQPAKAMVSLSTLRHPREEISDVRFLLTTLGKLWLNGVAMDWRPFYSGERRYRIPLPTYPFERQRFWVDPGTSPVRAKNTHALTKTKDLADWFSLPGWKRSLPPLVNREQLQGTWLVFLDAAGLGGNLIRGLQGLKVITVTPGAHFERKSSASFIIEPSRRAHYDSLVNSLRDLDSLPDHVVFLWSVTPDKQSAPPLEGLESVLSLNFGSLLFLAQAFAPEEHPARLTILSNQAQQVAGEAQVRPEKSLTAGPARVIPREFPHLATHTVDVLWPCKSERDVPRLVEQILAECCSTSASGLVALRGLDRWVQTFEPVRLDAVPSTKPWWRPHGVYLITGGLGGIGLVLAEHLAKGCQARLILVARRHLPPRDQFSAWLAEHPKDHPISLAIQSVLRLEALGSEVMVGSADVTDLDQMKGVLARAKACFGELHGVFHAAGVLDDGPMQLKTQEQVSRVLLPKVKGALVLEALLEDAVLDLFVLFSSVSAVIGLPGQVDYTAANAFLDSFAQYDRSRRGRRTLSINWSAWQQIGMAEKAVSKTHSPHPLPEPGAVQKAKHPFWDYWYTDPQGKRVFRNLFSRDRQWLLSEHVVKGGDALIPGTGYLELVRAAWKEETSPSDLNFVEISDVLFLVPFIVKAGENRELQLTLTGDRAGSRFSIESPSTGECHVTGKIRDLPNEAIPTEDINTLRTNCSRVVTLDDGFLKQSFMEFGPRWRNLKQIQQDGAEAFLSLQLASAFEPELGDIRAHPALLDMAIGGAQCLIPDFDPQRDFFVPFSYGRLVLKQPIPAKIFSHVRYRDNSKQGMALFDVRLFNEQGTELACVSDFVMTRLRRGQLTQESLETPAKAQDWSKSSSQERQTILREGILPHEGCEALDRALSHPGLAQVFISSLDLRNWISQVDAAARPAGGVESESREDGPKFSRPDLQAEFAAPNHDEEKFLAEVWRELLGLEKVGIHDDFFELGGQSLIAVRMFNRIKKTYHLDFPLAVLFQAPTIEKFAALIREQVDASVLRPVQHNAAENKRTGSRTEDAAAKASSPSSASCIVPINPGGNLPPFYVIHGVGGNIVEYTHLAKYLSRDLPLIGIQAQGLDGKKRILSRVDEIALTYIEEIRAFQPQGPYFFGGSSFGGIIAYAMAQHLLRKGEKVAAVVLFDSYGKDYPKPLPARLSIQRFFNKQRYRFDLHQSNLRLLGPAERLPYVREKLWKLVRRTRKYVRLGILRVRQTFQLLMLPKALRDQAKLTGEDPRLMRGIELPKVIRDVQAAAADAAMRYELKPYPGKVVLLRATSKPPGIHEDPTNGWGTLVKDLEIYDIPGHHGAIVREPRVRTLAQVLMACLARIRQEGTISSLAKPTVEKPNHDPVITQH